jgi:hypothetical protein
MQTIQDFVEKCEISYYKNMSEWEYEIDMLYYEINYLNKMLFRYLKNISGNTLSHVEKHNLLVSIHDRITQCYEDIHTYNECISYEDKEMTRIYNTYTS